MIEPQDKPTIGLSVEQIIEKIVEEIHANPYAKAEQWKSAWTHNIRRHLSPLLAAAQEEMRERCARIAEKHIHAKRAALEIRALPLAGAPQVSVGAEPRRAEKPHVPLRDSSVRDTLHSAEMPTVPDPLERVRLEARLRGTVTEMRERAGMHRGTGDPILKMRAKTLNECADMLDGIFTSLAGADALKGKGESK